MWATQCGACLERYTVATAQGGRAMDRRGDRCRVALLTGPDRARERLRQASRTRSPRELVPQAYQQALLANGAPGLRLSVKIEDVDVAHSIDNLPPTAL